MKKSFIILLLTLFLTITFNCYYERVPEFDQPYLEVSLTFYQNGDLLINFSDTITIKPNDTLVLKTDIVGKNNATIKNLKITLENPYETKILHDTTFTEPMEYYSVYDTIMPDSSEQSISYIYEVEAQTNENLIKTNDYEVITIE